MHEILAPVGNLEMLSAAIDAGADAVYLSGPHYGARAKKANFSFEALELAVWRAHLMDVNVYLAVNTLIKEVERAALERYLDRVIAIGVDAIIAQDLAVIAYLRRHYPDFPVHGSTQMSLYNRCGLLNARALGLSRVVVARELTLQQLKPLFCDDLPEIEVFAHGAMCYAFSGACLLSSFNGGRSGNRGQCAQSCRLNYSIEKKSGHLLSMRDLSTISGVATLLKYPISALKIEGRLRSADYVYHTVLAYRRAVDGANSKGIEPLVDNMYNAFNRTYSSGYLWNDAQRLNVDQASNRGEMVGVVQGNAGKFHLKIKLQSDLYVGDALKFSDGNFSAGTEVFNIYRDGQKVSSAQRGQVIAIDYRKKLKSGIKVYRTRSAALSELRKRAAGKRRIGVAMTLSVDGKKKVGLELDDGAHTFTIDAAAPAEIAQKRPTDLASVERQLSKLGDTPFYLKDCRLQSEQDFYLSAKALNQLRRSAIEQLTAIRTARVAPQKMAAKAPQRYPDVDLPRIVCKVTTMEQYNALKDYDVELYGDFYNLPQLASTHRVWRPFSQWQASSAAKQMVPGLNHVFDTADYLLDEHSQVMNIAAYDQLRALGVVDITLSPEVERSDALKLTQQRPFRLFCYGKLPLMYAATCPKREAGQDCRSCTKTFKIEGERMATMQVVCQNYILAYYTDKPIIRAWAWQATEQPLLLSFSDEDAATTRCVIEAVIARGEL
ncbi:MAG: hypothetical protein CSA13_00335 [Clostridiales bacterium]|nr:MAG: hypothetical protein CSB19_00355 [Clostridiales bacterium]PIE77250.1 MAG: hypothetical protein CSA13_00335 [Clostridiales bacterium]